ncbi:MAG: COX15/CtaA family protein [Gemmatimonadota bacterium]
MILTRRLGIAAVVVTYLQLTFGGIVRITGSGMGCGDHWPKCNGSWIPPFDQPTVMIEWTHRLLALLVVLTIGALVWSARRAGTGDHAHRVTRSATTAFVLVIVVALLGMITVKLGNTALATVAHWTLAMALLGVLLAAAVRAGALGGELAATHGGSPRSVRSIGGGAALALATVVLGGLVAKTLGAAAACPAFPLCGDTPAGIAPGVAHLQMTHRFLAFALLFHALAVAVAVRRRTGESAVVKRAVAIAATLVILQVVLGAAMILQVMPTSLRVAHQAAGVGVWMLMFLAAYLARAAEMGNRKSEMAH